MESQAVRRRLNTIGAHFLVADELSAPLVLPMNCSSTLNSPIRRGDNRLYFARQGGDFRPSFMKLGSIEDSPVETETQSNSSAPATVTARRYDNRLFFARQGSAHQAGFMRTGCNDEVESETPLKCSGPGDECSYYVSNERPLFSRPNANWKFSATGRVEQFFEGYGASEIDRPSFAVAGKIKSQQNEALILKDICSSQSKVGAWSPKMDVAESGRGYVITVEIPGVNIKDIRVEVDENKLSVAGKRYAQYMSAARSGDSATAYLRREIVQGPCEVTWQLPAGVNKDCVSAEFMDGFLRVVIPKL